MHGYPKRPVINALTKVFHCLIETVPGVEGRKGGEGFKGMAELECQKRKGL